MRMCHSLAANQSWTFKDNQILNSKKKPLLIEKTKKTKNFSILGKNSREMAGTAIYQFTTITSKKAKN